MTRNVDSCTRVNGRPGGGEFDPATHSIYYAKLGSSMSLEVPLSSLTLHLSRSRAALASSAELCPRSAVRSCINMPNFSLTLGCELDQGGEAYMSRRARRKG